MPLLIEQFRAVRKKSHQFPPDSIGGKLEAALFREIDRTLKYRFTDSALAMLLALARSSLTVTLPLAEQITPVWIEFTSPFTLDTYAKGISLAPVQGFYFSEHSPKSARGIPSSPGMEKYLQRTQDLYSLHVLKPDMWAAYRYTYRPGTKELLFTKPRHDCPTGECQFEELDYLAKDNPNRYIHVACLYCQTARCIFERLLSICLAMTRGDFAQTQEFVLPIQRERAIRRDSGSGKRHQVYEVEHTYHLVSFDACLRQVYRHEEGGKAQQQQQTPTWLERALSLDPQSILYVSRSIGKSERTLRSSYFVHKQGQTVRVKAHGKRIPRKLGTVTVTRASQYAEHDEQVQEPTS
jgi:hypothetical protein